VAIIIKIRKGLIILERYQNSIGKSAQRSRATNDHTDVKDKLDIAHIDWHRRYLNPLSTLFIYPQALALGFSGILRLKP
jgi:hypothetical protein